MSSEDPITLETLQDMLGLVMGADEVPDDTVLEQLTQPERDEIVTWAADCHFEASDNDVTAGPMPPVLRDQLPEGHIYKTWRVP
jgi:hypothetical protein